MEVPGTPEKGVGHDRHRAGDRVLVRPTEVDGRLDGEVTIDFGDYGKETAKVTAWEPPRRVVFEGSGERPLAYEWLVEVRDGGSGVVRLVDSGFGGRVGSGTATTTA